MRPCLVLSLAITMLSSAHAQSSSPEVTSLALPLALSARIDGNGEQGCSRGFAHSHFESTVRLTIDASGAAELTLDGSQHTVTVSPEVPGRHDDDTTHTRWSGTATITSGVVSIAFAPARTDVLRCLIAPTGVRPTRGAGETPMSLLTCGWASSRSSVMGFYVPGDLVLGAGTRLRMTWDQPMHERATRTFFLAR